MTTRLTLGPDAVADVEQFIFAMVKWGEHHHDVPRSWSLQQMREAIPKYSEVAEDVRQGYAVKYFENLLRATWHTGRSPEASGGISVRSPATEEQRTVNGPGVIELPTYAAIFETAFAAWHRAVQRESHAELLSALRDGISSIEAFINRRAAEWNAAHPEDQLTEKSQGRFVTFRRKIEEWSQTMTGTRIDPENSERLLKIKRYRDDIAEHPKHSVAAVSLEDLAKLLNQFTFGISVPFFNLHRIFRCSVPAVILRAAYAPIVSIESQ